MRFSAEGEWESRGKCRTASSGADVTGATTTKRDLAQWVSAPTRRRCSGLRWTIAAGKLHHTEEGRRRESGGKVELRVTEVGVGGRASIASGLPSITRSSFCMCRMRTEKFKSFVLFWSLLLFLNQSSPFGYAESICVGLLMHMKFCVWRSWGLPCKHVWISTNLNLRDWN